ncbi:serine/threonine-protein kinase [Streptosporangium sp. 'caverna']|uniref:serine/threonine-protein kinase n=1 Tax=Streptosporangium sp. 'caverna' TaxID=2202249 RepID=UPI0013A69BDE|nr:serine/threonine-protein kinase [Streptosporangium sp. 'caverna']
MPLGSRYVLLDEIGSGAMGTVWRARHRETGEIVAVKLLRDNLAGDQDLVLRFVQERTVMRTLRHPNIVTVRDFVIEGERLALVMDLVEGGDLRTLLRRRGTLLPVEAARLMAQVAGALAAAHAVGVVHRDIKPENVLIDGTAGQVRLTDFGVARILHGPGLTQTTSIIGTPTYLSPEVADGSAPTTAVDVYAIGLILYELLAGRPPFVGNHPMALLRQHATSTPRRLPGMPDVLWSVISACVAKDPAERPRAEEVAVSLGEAAPSLAGLPALPQVARGDAPSITSEPLPPAGSPMDASRTDPAAGAAGTSPAGDETTASTASTRRGRSRQRLLIITTTTAVALALSAAAVAVVAPWRTSDAGGTAGNPAIASAESAGGPTRAAGTTTTAPSRTKESTRESSPAPSPKVRPVRSRTPEAAVSDPPTRPSPAKSAARRTQTPRPQRSKTATVSPEPDGNRTLGATRPDAPNWQCRAWISVGTGTGTEMSPCTAMVGDAFYLLGRVRGLSSVRSDIHVQLYNTDAEVNVSQPFICSNVSPSNDGAIVTCGPFTATTPQISDRHNVRQRWRKSGTATFNGGSESPWIIW